LPSLLESLNRHSPGSMRRHDIAPILSFYD
jgi:hypothetical protein